MSQCSPTGVGVESVSSFAYCAASAFNAATSDGGNLRAIWDFWTASHPVTGFARAGTTKEGRDAGRRLLEDEKRFIDLTRSPIWFGEEHALVDLTR